MAIALAVALYLQLVPPRRVRAEAGQFQPQSRFRRPWSGKPGTRWQSRSESPPQPASQSPPWPRDAVDQLRIVMAADFGRQRLLLRGEERVFRCTEEVAREMRPGCRVMAKVSLGEVLKSPDADAFLSINCKRVDLLIVDEDF